jgi:hypothetical protein
MAPHLMREGIDLRDGSPHGGCQARCLLFWKEDWLETFRPVFDALLDERSEAGPRRATGAGRCHAWCRAPGEAPVDSCQATELLQDTRFVPARDPGVWVKDVRSRNAGVATALLSLLVLVFTKVQGASARLPRRLRIQDGRSWPWFTPTGERRSYPTLDRQPGELVEVRKQRGDRGDAQRQR